jgi:hypothetical protein
MNRIIIFRTQADRQRYCDEQLASIFGSRTSRHRFREETTRMMLKAVAWSAAMFAAWAFFSPRAHAGEVDCMTEAARFEVAAQMRDSGVPREELEHYLRDLLFMSPQRAARFLMDARLARPNQLWYWAHGACSFVFRPDLIAGARIRQERAK